LRIIIFNNHIRFRRQFTFEI